MRRKIFFVTIIIVTFIFTMIPASTISASPATPGTNLNLYLGYGVASDSYVKFGQYNGSDIIWRVLLQDNGTNGVLLISDKILTQRAYNSTVVIWRDSAIRSWLNGDFYNNLGADKSYVQSSTITTNSVNTVDYVFLADDNTITASPFDADSKRIALYNSSPSSYWLINIVDIVGTLFVRYVSVSGSVGGDILSSGLRGIRPLLYLQQGLSFSGSGSESNPYVIYTGSGEVTSELIRPINVRTMPMTCYQVWINKDNNFQFVFWYPYRDNNWVKIYDMSGKEVFSIDMPYDNPNIIVDLPDGMYTVKTFTVGSTEPIQEFVIGKP